MLFTPDSIVKARQGLFELMEAGTLTPEQAFRQALELDPYDAVALAILGEERHKAGDLGAGAECCWRAVSADPCSFEPWFKLYGCLPDESSEFRNGILELAALKALRQPERLDGFKETFKSSTMAKDFTDAEEFLEVTADQFGEMRRDEPEDVSERLRPYRLVDDLLATAADGLDGDLVDGILEDGARCIPLLVGVLRATVTGSLPESDPSPVVHSLALLGEIGDPAVLPEVIECYALDDEAIQAAVEWALQRIAPRRPEASFDAIRKLALEADADRRCDLALAIGFVPEQPGKRDFLLSLLDGLAAVPKPDRAELFMSVALGLEHCYGAKGRELAWSLLTRHSALLPKRTRAELREAFQIHDEIDRYAPEGEPPEATVYDFCSAGYAEEEEEDEEDNPFDDEDLDEGEHNEDLDDGQGSIPEPVRRSATPGRNDPCWCGSGKKYKKCHLEPDEKSRATAPPRGGAPLKQHTTEEAGLRGRLIEFATSTLRKREMEESLLMFLGTELPAGVEEGSLTGEAMDWMLHDYVPPRFGHPIIEEFLKRSPGGLSPRQRQILEGWSRSRFSVFEVQEVREGSGVRLKDLLAGGEISVDDVTTSKWAVQWDCLLARIEELSGRHIFTAIVLTIPEDVVAPLKEWAIGAHQRSGLDWDAFLHAQSHKLRQEYSRLVNRPAGAMQVVSFEGDEMVFSNARYAVEDEDAVHGALAQSKAFLRGEDPADYGWLDENEDAGGARRAYGHVHIGGGELRLECSTRERLERGKKLLRSVAGKHLRHLGDDFTALNAAMRDRKPAPGTAKGSGIPPEVERELVAKVLGEHYDRWPDMPLPALDGRTPREALATAEGRAQVVDVLKLLQDREEHRRRDGQTWYDIARLKAALGVEF
jgi:hypothetical protein